MPYLTLWKFSPSFVFVFVFVFLCVFVIVIVGRRGRVKIVKLTCSHKRNHIADPEPFVKQLHNQILTNNFSLGQNCGFRQNLRMKNKKVIFNN